MLRKLHRLVASEMHLPETLLRSSGEVNLYLLTVIMTTEVESITTTTAKSVEENIEKTVEKLAAEADLPTWGLVAILIGNLSNGHFIPLPAKSCFTLDAT
jgi:hypothetical protein